MIKKVPPKVDFIQLEHEMLQFWDDNQIFANLIAKNAKGPRWSFIDGPITANNPMGVHHAWGRTYKDIFQRYKAMQGYQTRYQNGFDCQGLWVEVEVEKELGFKSKTDIEDYGIEKFVNKCKQRVRKYSAIQTEQSIRLGYWMDWDNSYYTMSPENNYTIWLFLKKCHEQGWIYKGHDVMPWCTRCGAALSEHEIATEGYREMTHTGVTVRLPLLERNQEFLLIWTTTPWTLTSNTAAAVHPEKTYLKVRQKNKVYYLIEGRKEILKGDYQLEDTLTGKEMLGWQYQGPFDELPAQQEVQHRVIPWEEVTETEGTGIVHIAPGCGQEDHQLGEEYDLAVIAPLDDFGDYLEGFDWLSGKNVDEVTDLILKDLKAKGIAYRHEPYTHRYPVCWRHGTPLVFRLVDEWFINMDAVRHDMMAVTRQIEWIPAYGLQRELDWLRNMDDWMISKKRFWGLALPIYECEACGKITVLGSRAELQQKAVEGWGEFDGHTPHRPWIDKVKIKCENCGETVRRVEDVGNPWLDAGIVPFSTLKYTTDPDYWEKWFPAEFICESLPGQFRNWFYSLIAMSTVLENKPPFLTVLGYQLVKDENGEDMHKSTGNAIWFDEAAEKMGVDVMRWLYASHSPFNNLLFGYNIAKETRKRLITLWNSYSFFATYAALDGYDPQKHIVDRADLSELDRWLLARLNQLYQLTARAYDKYAVDKGMQYINTFLEDLSNWYIRRSRRRFWKSEDDQDKWAAYQTLYTALKGLILLLSPVIPFVTDYIYQNLVRGLEPKAPESIHLADFPQGDQTYIDEALIQRINLIIKIVSLGRAARNKADLKVRQPLHKLLVKLPLQAQADLQSLSDQIRAELNVKEVEILNDETRVVDFIVKPDFKSLKQKYADDIGAIRQAINDLDPEKTAHKLAHGGTVELTLPAKKVFLEGEDLIIERHDKEGYAVMSEGDYTVAIDTQLNQALIDEGLVRDFIRHIQTMRKEADFKVEDRIRIAGDFHAKLKQALQQHWEYLKAETLANRVDSEFKPGEFEKQIKIAGKQIPVSISREKKQ